MKFAVNLACQACLLSVTLLLAACGGGDPVEEFRPTRVLAFGDEGSVITDASFPGGAGWKYTVNQTPPNNPLNPQDPVDNMPCNSNPIWVQVLASVYGLVFPECPGTVVNSASRILAISGDKVADTVTRIDAFIAGGGFRDKDLATVLVGTHDIEGIFDNRGVQSDAALVAQAEAAGTAVAAQVNRIADAGARVIVATLPELGLTPYGIEKNVATPGAAALLNTLTESFNRKLLLTLINDGHKIGLVEADRMVRNIVNAPASNGYDNVIAAACAPVTDLPNSCTEATNDANGMDATRWLWAGELQLGVGAHSSLGSLASSRARNNPF